ncbi:MAG: transcriptional repressor [Candidatus Thermoplasmatota archaeon]
MKKTSRRTRQKESIRDEISKSKSFFTVEELYDKIKEKNPAIGIATVYRYLKELRRNKKIHSYICNRRMIYSKEDVNHCHFICERCGRIKHFNIDRIDFLREKIKGDVCHFQVDVYGVCEDCLREIKE